MNMRTGMLARTGAGTGMSVYMKMEGKESLRSGNRGGPEDARGGRRQ